jgi:hypothetical protein
MSIVFLCVCVGYYKRERVVLVLYPILSSFGALIIIGG